MMKTYIVSLSWSGYGLYRVRDNQMFEDREIREAAIAAVSDYDRFEQFLCMVNEIRFRYDDSDTDTTFEMEKKQLSEGIVSYHLIHLLMSTGTLVGTLDNPEYQIGVKYLKIMDPLTRDLGFPCTYDPFIGFLINAAELHFERYVNYKTDLEGIEKRLDEEEGLHGIEKKDIWMMSATELMEFEEKRQRILNIYKAEKEEKEKRKEMKSMKKMMNKEKMKMILKNKKKMPHLLTEEEANKKKKRAMKAEEKKRLINDYEEEKRKLIVESCCPNDVLTMEAMMKVLIEEDRKKLSLWKKKLLLWKEKEKEKEEEKKKKEVEIVEEPHKKWRKLAVHSSTLDSV